MHDFLSNTAKKMWLPSDSLSEWIIFGGMNDQTYKGKKRTHPWMKNTNTHVQDQQMKTWGGMKSREICTTGQPA